MLSSDRKILVIGDLMLDKYINGDVSRISPEAPVQVVNVKNEIYFPGGAANVASNISTLKGKCFVAGFIGQDDSGKILINELNKRYIDTSCIKLWNSPTILKVRVFSGQQLIRLDYEEKTKTNDELINEIKKIIDNIDIIIISDYDKGTINEPLINQLKLFNKKIIIDPKPNNIKYYNDLFLIKPNIKEAEEITGIKYKDEQSLNLIGNNLIKLTNSNILITLGKEGMILFEKQGDITHFPTKAKEVYDVTGAGDTATAALAVSISNNSNLKEAVVFANHAAGIKVSKRGTANVSLEEIKKSLEQEESKIKSIDKLTLIIEDLKRNNKKIVFTNGCFDILHVGHTRLLSQAKKLGDILILGLNTDYSVRILKGENRPVINEKDRAEILSSLECIDFIVFFNEDTPLELVKKIKPDVIVKGGDYSADVVVGEDIVKAYGGKVVIIPLIEEYSTTKIIQKINE